MTTSIPKTMRAVVLTGHGGFDKLNYVEDWPTPTPAAGEVLVEVAACGLNNTDINTRVGWYSKSVSGATDNDIESASGGDATWGGSSVSFPRIQGADVVGVVVAIGQGAPRELLGRRVLIDTWLRDWNAPMEMEKAGYFGSERDGGYADYTTISARHIHPIDSTMSDAELATFATSYTTAENMLNRASVTADDTVVISGASGGVGSALIQLAKRRGAKTVALCATDKMAEMRMKLGATVVLSRHTKNLRAALGEATGQDTASVFADVVGGAQWPNFIDMLSRGGRYVCSGAIAGPIVEFDLRTFYLRDLTFFGGTVVSPGVFADVVGYIERGEIRPLLAKTFLLRDLAKAQAMFLEKNFIGNIVVTME